MKVSLKAARVNAELTQKAVADALGVNVDRVKYIEKHSANVDYTTLDKLCKIYNAEIDDIFLPINCT